MKKYLTKEHDDKISVLDQKKKRKKEKNNFFSGKNVKFPDFYRGKNFVIIQGFPGTQQP